MYDQKSGSFFLIDAIYSVNINIFLDLQRLLPKNGLNHSQNTTRPCITVPHKMDGTCTSKKYVQQPLHCLWMFIVSSTAQLPPLVLTIVSDAMLFIQGKRNSETMICLCPTDCYSDHQLEYMKLWSTVYNPRRDNSVQ